MLSGYLPARHLQVIVNSHVRNDKLTPRSPNSLFKKLDNVFLETKFSRKKCMEH